MDTSPAEMQLLRLIALQLHEQRTTPPGKLSADQMSPELLEHVCECEECLVAAIAGAPGSWRCLTGLRLQGTFYALVTLGRPEAMA